MERSLISYFHRKYLKIKTPLKFFPPSWELVRGEAELGALLAVTAKGLFTKDPCWKKAREYM